MFSKTGEPLDADDWLQSMENNLEVTGVDAAEKVLFATHYLSEPARAWWNSTRVMNRGQMMTWEDFKLKFSRYHVPPGYLEVNHECSLSHDLYITSWPSLELHHFLLSTLKPIYGSSVCLWTTPRDKTQTSD
jgi:hypothetical protein